MLKTPHPFNIKSNMDLLSQQMDEATAEAQTWAQTHPNAPQWIKNAYAFICGLKVPAGFFI